MVMIGTAVQMRADTKKAAMARPCVPSWAANLRIDSRHRCQNRRKFKQKRDNELVVAVPTMIFEPPICLRGW